MTYRPQTIQESRVLAKTELQKEYLAFFQKKLDQYGVDSPADMDDKTKKKFFNEIEVEWTEGEGESGVDVEPAPEGEGMTEDGETEPEQIQDLDPESFADDDSLPAPTDALDEATEELDDLVADEMAPADEPVESMDDTCPDCGEPMGECMCGEEHGEGMGCGDAMGGCGPGCDCPDCQAAEMMDEEELPPMEEEEDEDPESEADYMARMYAVTEVASSLKSVGTLTHLALEEAAEALTSLGQKKDPR